MPTCFLLRVIPVLAVAVSLGCNDTPSYAPSSSAGANSQSSDPTNSDGVVKIAIMADGIVYLNSKTVPIHSLSSELDEIGEINEIWYHREAPEAAEPHENAMKAIAEIANRKLPIAMYVDREFKQRVNLGGQ